MYGREVVLVGLLQRIQKNFKITRAIYGPDIVPGLQADEAALEALLVEVVAPRSLLELGMARVLGLGGDLGELPATLRVKVEAWPESGRTRYTDWARRGADLLRNHMERMELVDKPWA
jgi:hypothetical protein